MKEAIILHNTADTLSNDTDAYTVEIDTSSRRGRWGFAGLIIAIVGVILLFTGSLCSAQDYTVPLNIEYGLVDVSGITVDNADNLYVLSNQLSAVNVYTSDGEFQYSIKVPDYPNGGNEIYVLDDVLYIQDKGGNIYAYQNGVYRGRAAYADDDEDAVTINVYDENNRMLYSLTFPSDGNWYSLLLLKGSSVYVERQDAYGSSVQTFENGQLIADEPYTYTDFFTESVAQDSEGNIFDMSSFGPQLIKIPLSGEDVVIASTSWIEWLWRTSVSGIILLALGIIIALASRLARQERKN